MSLGSGVFVPVVGPSGAGKDSLMSYASAQLEGKRSIRFARRVITRPADLSTEAHDTLDQAAFDKACAEGAFALWWRSHGLGYGIPATVDETIRTGGVVVANISRASVGEAVARYARVMPVIVTVSPAILATRLAMRGRETADEIASRMARNAEYASFGARCHIIENDGTLEEGGNRLIELLLAAADRSALPEARSTISA